MNESNDEPLERARRGIRALAATLHERPRQARVAPGAARSDERIEPGRLDYRIGELTDAHYRAFVEQAFHALLKRMPTATESGAQIALLAAGATKAEVLGNLRWSAEGRRIGARVAGLLPRYASAKLRRIPVLGYLADVALTLAALPQLARHQRASDALLAAGDEAAAAASAAGDEVAAATSAALAERFARVEAAQGQRLDLLQQRVDDLRAHAHGLRGALDELTRALVDANAAWGARIGALGEADRTHVARLDDLEMVRRQLHRVMRWSDAIGDAFDRIDVVAAEREQDDGRGAAAIAAAAVAADATRAARNAAWAACLGERLAARARVLALASDADWAGLLVARGFEVIDVGRAHQDADVARRALLARHADASLDAVTALALPVLLPGWTLAGLLEELRRVLRPGGVALCASAREGVALVGSLRGTPGPVLEVDLVGHALATAGFVDVQPVSAADGSPALLARAP